MGRVIKIYSKLKSIYHILSVLNIKLECSVTSKEFKLLTFISDLYELPEVNGVNKEIAIEAAEYLYLFSSKRLTPERCANIVIDFPLLGMLFLVWNRYGILKPDLTIWLLCFYLAESKQEASIAAQQYCYSYLEQTVNPALSIKKKFRVDILESKEEEPVKIQVHNDDYGFITETPKAMPTIVNQITEKELGIN